MSRIDLPPGWVMVMPAGVSAGGLGGDRHALQELARYIQQQRSPVSHFISWVRSALDCTDPRAEEEAGVLYATFLAHCEGSQVPTDQRLSFTKFGLSMSACGLRRRKSGNGRIVRTGCRLRGEPIDRPHQAEMFTDDPNAAVLSEWIEICCDLSDPGAREQATPLYLAYRQFCLDRGDNADRIMKQTAFGLRLNDLQIPAAPNHGTGKRERVGIRLVARPASTASPAPLLDQLSVQLSGKVSGEVSGGLPSQGELAPQTLESVLPDSPPDSCPTVPPTP